MKKTRIFFFSFLFLCGAYYAYQNHQYNKDLTFMYEQILNNHPGVYNEDDPEFKKNLDTFYQEAHKSLKFCISWKQALEEYHTFLKKFDDPHLRVNKPTSQSTLGDFSIKEEGPLVWITLPTFHKLSDQQKNDFQHIVNSLDKYKKDRIIIFDISKNGGGNSAYGNKIIKNFFGNEYFNTQSSIHLNKKQIYWRASQENLNHLKEIDQELLVGSFPHSIIKGIEEALNNKSPFYISPSFPAPKNNPRKHSVTSKIVVVISGKNSSAALMFIDRLKIMDYPITLVGKETKKDRVYTEVRIVDLPSKKGLLIFPIKIIKNRFRADNTGYTPDIECDPENKAALKEIIEQL